MGVQRTKEGSVVEHHFSRGLTGELGPAYSGPTAGVAN